MAILAICALVTSFVAQSPNYRETPLTNPSQAERVCVCVCGAYVLIYLVVLFKVVLFARQDVDMYVLCEETHWFVVATG